MERRWSKMAARQPRERLCNFRINSEEDERFKRVAKRLGLEVSSMLRLMVARADYGPGAKPAPQHLADLAWLKAHEAFLQTGVADTLAKIMVVQKHTRATLAALDEASAEARTSGETSVRAALDTFRAEVLRFQGLDRDERAGRLRELSALLLAYAEASRQMFGWATRRATTHAI
jgi:hypothetical protein